MNHEYLAPYFAKEDLGRSCLNEHGLACVCN